MFACQDKWLKGYRVSFERQKKELREITTIPSDMKERINRIDPGLTGASEFCEWKLIWQVEHCVCKWLNTCIVSIAWVLYGYM